MHMLSLLPNDLAQEVQKAEDFRRRHTLRIRRIQEFFVSNWYRTDHHVEAVPENSIFAYVSYMLPSLWYSNPSCRIHARRPQQDGAVADMLEAAIRSWLDETTFTQEGQEVIRDALLGYAVMQVGIEPRDTPGDRKQQDAPGQQAPTPLRPFAVRLSPEQLIIDPLCEDPQKARFIGHIYYKDLDQIQAEAIEGMWDAEAVTMLTTVPRENYDEMPERAMIPGESADRRRVNLVDLWLPEHNLLVTLARCNQATNIVLRATPYIGPPEGPYEVFGFYSVPGDPFPMSPLQPIMEQLEEMWSHQRAASADAVTYKRFILYEEADPSTGKAIGDARSGEAHPVKGLGNFKEVEMGGTPAGRLAHIENLRERTDRTIGLSDAQRGRVQGKTATETDIVQGNVDTRTSFLRQRVQWHTRNVMSRIAWYMFYDPNVQMPVSHKDPATGEIIEGTYFGGIAPGQEGLEWVNFHLSIEPTSMSFTDDGTLVQRAMTLAQLAQEVGQSMVQMPQVNWRYVVNTYGDAYNQKDLFDILFNQQALSQFGQVPPAFGYAPPGANVPPNASAEFGGGGMGGPPMGPAPVLPGGPPQAGVAVGMPGLPPMGLGGGGSVPFAPRQGGVAGPIGQPPPPRMMQGNPRAALLSIAARSAGPRMSPLVQGNPRTPMPQARPTPQMRGGSPRAMGNAPHRGKTPVTAGNPKSSRPPQQPQRGVPMLSGNPRQKQNTIAARPVPMLTGNPRVQKKLAAAPPHKPMATGNPRSQKKKPAAGPMVGGM